MSNHQAHLSIGPPDRKDMSGEEAWARRCSLPSPAPWNPQPVKPEGNDLQDTLSTHLPSTLHDVEEGEISDTQPYNRQSPSSEALSFLYSIPQWQPPSMPITGQQLPQRPYPPLPAQRTSVRRKKPLPTQPRGQRPIDPLRDVGYDEDIPNIHRNDILDKRIGIRPRHKKSKELQLIKDQRHGWNADGASLPGSMKMMIQQFMVANGYVFPHKNLTTGEISTFRNSLMVRLDLHKQPLLVTKGTQKIIKSRWRCVDAFVTKQSRDWQAQGVFKQVPETAGPTFAAFTNRWTDRTWDGSTCDIAYTTALTTRPPMLPMSLASNGPLRPKDSETSWEAPHSVIVLDVGTEGPPDGFLKGPKPTLKRPGQDSPNNRANKRAHNGDYASITTEHMYVDHIHDEANGLDDMIPEEKGLSMVIEAICHARNTLLNFAPMTANDLADLQQDWVSHGFTDMLSEALSVGRAHTLTMGKYFDSALELVSFLKGSYHWEAGDGKVQVNCPCRQGSAAPKQLPNGKVPIPSVSSDGEGEIRQSRQQEDAIPDQSPDGKVSNRLISTGDIRVDRQSGPKVAVLDQLDMGIASNTPVALTEKAIVLTKKAIALTENAVVLTEKAIVLTEKAKALAENAKALTEKAKALTEKAVALTDKAQVDHLYQSTVSTVARVQNNEVANPLGAPPRTSSPCEAMGVDEKDFVRLVLTA